MRTRPETIYALASAPGKSGVAVFRVSGADACAVLPYFGIAGTPTPRMAHLVQLTEAGTPIDQALALYFPNPNSFTGEDVLELHTHGSRAVTSMLLDALGRIPGLRLAEPGEFARRAFLNGKLDLAQAEGLADLIDAETKSQHRQAIRQFQGDASRRISDLRERIITPLALLEAYIDFPDEDIPEEVLAETTESVARLIADIGALLDDGRVGEKIREGIDVVILGPPNAGKSSLLNALARRDVAIVSAEAGTTRDLIEVHLDLSGYAVTLVDTAGLRDAPGAIEAEGIRRARARAEQAELTLAVFDRVSVAEQYAALRPELDENTLLIANKTDLAPGAELPVPMLEISAQTGAGIPELIAQLTARVADRLDGAAAPLITRARHREALQSALASLGRFHPTMPLELNCEELRLAAQFIGKITGKIWVDDVLDLVFSRFCIGK